MKIVYSDRYAPSFGRGHVFPVTKYRLCYESLQRDIPRDAFIEPEPARDEDVLRAHDFHYIQRLRLGLMTEAEVHRSEVPYSSELVDFFWLATGGTILASTLATEEGLAANLSGGFHHAFADRAEGFCLINDIAVAIRTLQHRGTIQSAMVLDCDVHQGNGTAAIFSSDPTVFTVSFHQQNNYPHEKPAGSLDIALADGCGDEEYLNELDQALVRAFDQFQPDLVVYAAGADPFQDDQLGGLALSKSGLLERDRRVFERCARSGVPCAVVLAGGYSRVPQDTVTIHANTVRLAFELGSGRTPQRTRP